MKLNDDIKYRRKETRRLVKNISRRLERVRKLGFRRTPPSLSSFERLDIPKKLSSLSDKDLNSLFRQLEYINTLKTSTVKGAIKYQESFGKIFDVIEGFSKENKDKFWEAYGKTYENMPTIAEKYKYIIFDEIIDYQLQGGIDPDKFAQEALNAFINVQLEYGEKDNETFRILYSQELRNILE